MQRALVVIDEFDSIEFLLQKAGQWADGVGGSLVLLHVTTESEYEKDRRAFAGVNGVDVGPYDVEQASEGAAQIARDLGDELLAEYDLEYEGVGAIGDKFEQIMGAVQDHDCDHVFIAGRKRSPSGKAIFGDTAQKVILNVDCPVTIITE